MLLKQTLTILFGGVVSLSLLACTSSPAVPTMAVLATRLPQAQVKATTAIFDAPTGIPTTSTAVPSMTPPATPTPAPTPCSIPGHIETGVLNSRIAGELAFRVYVPPCYGGDGRLYPTLYMLPGNIHTDAFWDDIGLDETAENGIESGLWPPFLIVMPDGGWIANNTSGGDYSYEGVIIQDLIPFIETHYCAWNAPEGRAIGGVSRGGYWALEIAFRQPEKFVSVGGHSAALLDVAAGPSINPQQTGLTNDLGALRIYLDIGSEDYVIHNIRRLHEGMETAVPPIQHTWVLNEGRHEDAYWSAHLEAYLTWYTAVWPMSRRDYPLCD